jgi:hypothetical protein
MIATVKELFVIDWLVSCDIRCTLYQKNGTSRANTERSRNGCIRGYSLQPVLRFHQRHVVLLFE